MVARHIYTAGPVDERDRLRLRVQPSRHLLQVRAAVRLRIPPQLRRERLRYLVLYEQAAARSNLRDSPIGSIQVQERPSELARVCPFRTLAHFVVEQNQA